MKDLQSQLLETFLAESDELIAQIESGLVELGDSPDDPEAINKVFRVAHTFKGNAGMIGADRIVDLAHAMEGLLDQVRSGALRVEEKLISALLAGIDALRGALHRMGTGEPPGTAFDFGAALAGLGELALTSSCPEKPGDGAAAPPAQAAPASLATYELRLSFPPKLFEEGLDPFLILEELARLGELTVEAELEGLPAFGELQPARLYLTWRVVLRTEAPRSEIEKAFLFVSDPSGIVLKKLADRPPRVDAADKMLGELLVENALVSEQDVKEALNQQKKLGELLVSSGKLRDQDLKSVLAVQEAARQTRQASSIRVGVEKVDRMVNLVGELVIAILQANQALRNDRAAESVRLAASEALERIGRDLQEQVMSVRMVPVRDTFDRFKRIVRDLAAEVGKKVCLETAGIETELDKNVVEQLVDPLKHMVRNCISHGLENPERRRAAGKDETGTIRLSAEQREGRILIEVSDDGAGIDLQRVLAKAREAGLVRGDAPPSERQILDFIFQPGFSTAEVVSELAGRGVGLDVVRRNVDALHGFVNVKTIPGKGTTFQINLPLTLAIIEGMNVTAGGVTMTIPVLSVLELVEVLPGTLQAIGNRGEVLSVRGETVPAIRLDRLLGIGGRSSAKRVAVIIDHVGHKFGLVVDRVLGVEQAVIKPLGTVYALVAKAAGANTRKDGFSGATILGDGGVSLIIDIHGIDRMVFGDA